MTSHGHHVINGYIDKNGKETLGKLLNIVELGFPDDGRFDSAKRQVNKLVNDFLRGLKAELGGNYHIEHTRSEHIQIENIK